MKAMKITVAVVCMTFVVCSLIGTCTGAKRQPKPTKDPFIDFANEPDLKLITEDDERPPTIFSGDVMQAKTTLLRHNKGNGRLSYNFETQNGINIAQIGKLKDDKTYVVTGSYSYTGADGKKYRVKYTADELGYHPITELDEGDDIEITPPPPRAVATPAPFKPFTPIKFNAPNDRAGKSLDGQKKKGYNYEPNSRLNDVLTNEGYTYGVNGGSNDLLSGRFDTNGFNGNNGYNGNGYNANRINEGYIYNNNLRTNTQDFGFNSNFLRANGPSAQDVNLNRKYLPTQEYLPPQQYSPIQPQYTPVQPQYNPVQPQYTPVQPQYTPAQPQYTPVQPQYTPVQPEYTPVQPQYTPVRSQYTPVSPQYFAALPQLPVPQPQYPVAQPQSNLYLPSQY